MMQTTLTWQKEGLRFSSTDSKGKTLLIDGNSEIASSPMTLLLHAISGCSASDIILILERMRQTVTSLEIITEGVRGPENEYPRPWKKLHLHFKITGPIEPEKAEKAVSLSMEKYCSVSAMLKHDAEITWNITLNP